MGKRGKVSPTKDEKSKDNQKERKQVIQENSKSASPDAGSGSDIKLESLKALVVIDPVSRRLAEQALSKVVGGQEVLEKKPSVRAKSTSTSNEAAQSYSKRYVCTFVEILSAGTFLP